MRTTITSQRLCLRPFHADDARRLAYLAGDYEVARMCGRVPNPYPVSAAASWINSQPKRREEGEEFPFAVTLAHDGLIGSCGLTRVEADPQGVYELGYWLGRAYWGEGYAVEAARTLMTWASEELAARRFTAGHFLDNPASGRVLKKLGFVQCGEDDLFGLARQRTSPVARYVWSEQPVEAKQEGSQALADAS